jgi:anti-sigma B factor antagonist
VEVSSKDLSFLTVADRLPSSNHLLAIVGYSLNPEGTTMKSSKVPRRRLEVEDVGDVTIATFTDKKILDEEHIRVLGEQLFNLVDEVGRKNLLLNFRNVEYMSSAALGKLITLNKKVAAAGGKLVLCAIDPQIHEVFRITSLDKHFVIRGDEEEALQTF